MADNFSDIMSKYKDMSVSELGSSLLQRKEEKDRQAAKSIKKSERMQQALGVLLAGQAVFKGAFNRRSKELESAYQFQLADNESQAREINLVSKLTQPMYQWAQTTKDQTFKNEEEKLNAFVESPYFDSFRIAINGYTEPAFKSMLGDKYETFSRQAGYSNAQVEAAKAYASEYLKDNKYETVVSELQNIFDMPEKDFDAIDLFKRGNGLKLHELNEIERRNYQRILNTYKDDSNLFSGIKQVFKLFNDKEARKGGIPLFKTIDEKVLLGPSINSVLDSLDFQGLTNKIVNDQLVKMNKSPLRAEALFELPKNKTLRDSLPARMDELSRLVDSKKFSLYNDLSKDGKANIISQSDLDDLFDNMSEIDKQELQRDGGLLSILLDPKQLENQQFLKALYKSNHTGDVNITFDQFKNKLQNETFRVQYAMTLAASEGYKNYGFGLSTGMKTSRYDPESGNVLNVVYDRYSGSIPSLLGETINLPTKNNPNYRVGDGWRKLTTENKLDDINAAVFAIQRKPISDKLKQVELDNLFANVPHPLKLTSDEHIQSDQYLKFVNKVMGVSTKTSDEESKEEVEGVDKDMQNLKFKPKLKGIEELKQVASWSQKKQKQSDIEKLEKIIQDPTAFVSNKKAIFKKYGLSEDPTTADLRETILRLKQI
jgi:hypothetical protein